MTISHAIWTVGVKPKPLPAAVLPSEQLLEQMIVASTDILSTDWMLIGRQEATSGGGRIDLLAIAPDASLVLIEIKRDRTPREVVAQALDYASWVETLDHDEIAAIYERFAPSRSLADDFRSRFNRDLDESELNLTHQLVIVAGALDPSSERIVSYLSTRGIEINVVCFQVFELNGEKLLSRAWLLDPVETAASTPQSRGGREPTESWIGEFYSSYGAGPTRSWDEARRYGFICGGGGAWYSRTLNLPSLGDRVWVKVPEQGFVGVARVSGAVQPMKTFTIMDGSEERSAQDVLTQASYHREFIDDPERCEYFLPVEWLDTVDIGQAVQEVGMFGNQNTVCAPRTQRWRHTVDRLKTAFPDYDAPQGQGTRAGPDVSRLEAAE